MKREIAFLLFTIFLLEAGRLVRFVAPGRATHVKYMLRALDQKSLLFGYQGVSCHWRDDFTGP